MGFKATSSVITISSQTTELAPNTFIESEVDLQLSPLDNEVFVVLAIDLLYYRYNSINNILHRP